METDKDLLIKHWQSRFTKKEDALDKERQLSDALALELREHILLSNARVRYNAINIPTDEVLEKKYTESEALKAYRKARET